MSTEVLSLSGPLYSLRGFLYGIVEPHNKVLLPVMTSQLEWMGSLAEPAQGHPHLQQSFTAINPKVCLCFLYFFN